MENTFFSIHPRHSAGDGIRTNKITGLFPFHRNDILRLRAMLNQIPYKLLSFVIGHSDDLRDVGGDIQGLLEEGYVEGDFFSFSMAFEQQK